MRAGFRARDMVDLTVFAFIARINGKRDRRTWDHWCESCRAERAAPADPGKSASAAPTGTNEASDGAYLPRRAVDQAASVFGRAAKGR